MQDQSNDTEAKKVVELGYDKVVQEYNDLEGELEWPRMRWLAKVLDKLAPNDHILDLGSGSGDPTAIEIVKEHQVTGVDISEEQIKLAKQNVPEGNFIHHDVGSVEFPDNTFNAVVSFYTLEHIPRKEHATILQRIYRWLKPHGYLLISIEAADIDDMMGEWLGVPMFFSIWPPETMKQIVAEAGFEFIEAATEIQVENTTEIPYLWIFAQKK